MQRAQHTDGARIGLQFGFAAGDPRAAVLGLVLYASGKARKNLLAQGLSFFDRLGLRRPEQNFCLRGNGGAGDRDAGRSAGQLGK